MIMCYNECVCEPMYWCQPGEGGGGGDKNGEGGGNGGKIYIIGKIGTSAVTMVT